MFNDESFRIIPEFRILRLTFFLQFKILESVNSQVYIML